MEEADLFMECEEEELEPWQQMNQDELHESSDMAGSPATSPVPKQLMISCMAPSSTNLSTVPLLPNALPTAVPTGICKSGTGQHLILTQGAGGLTPVALSQVIVPGSSPVSSASSSSQPIYLTTQGIPVQNVPSGQSPLSIVLNVQQGQTVRPITLVQAPGAPGIFRPAVGTSQIITSHAQTSSRTPLTNRPQTTASFTTMQIPATITIRSATPSSQPRATPVASNPGSQLSIPQKALPLNAQTKIVVKPGSSNLDIHNLMSIVNSVNFPAGAQSQTIVVMSNQKANDGGATAAVQSILPPAQSHPEQVPSEISSFYSCLRCGTQFKKIEALRSHMSICCSDVSHTESTKSDVAVHEPQNRTIQIKSLPLKIKQENVDTSLVELQARIIMLVDDFYYGTFEGNRAYVPTDNLKEPFTFKCLTCGMKQKNNIRLMKHLKSHMQSEQRHEEKDTHTSCPHCYRQFPTLFLQSHVENVHSKTESSSRCKICEWAFESEAVFLQHMKNTHKPGEMPYVCQVCQYRSSFYSDVHNHFCTWHEDTCNLLCIYCLKVFKSSGTFQHHFSQHQKTSVYHCNKCRLQFLCTKEKIEHKVSHHKTFRKPSQLEGLQPGTKVIITAHIGEKPGHISSKTSKKNEITTISNSGHTSPVYINSRKEPLVQQSTGVGKKKNIKMYYFLTEFQKQRTQLGRQKCVECTFDIPDFANHFPTYVHCSLCTYSTCCSRAYANHMIDYHVQNRAPKARKKSSLSWLKLTCAYCNYKTNQGDLMAKHLARSPSHCYSVITLKQCLETDIEFCQAEEEEVEGAKDVEAKSDWLSMEDWRVPSDEGFVPEFKECCGAQHLLAGSSDVLDYFQLMFPDTLIDQIVKETNIYAEYQSCLGKGPPTWHSLNNEEVKGFIGLSILMGLQVLPDPEMYWSWEHYQSCSTFYRTMSASRFKQISKNIRMNSMLINEDQHNVDKLSFFQPMLKILETKMLKAYRPNKCLTIDRTLLQTHENGADGEKSRNSPPQIWLLCDSKSGYCHKLLILTEQENNKDLGGIVVPYLLQSLEGKHHQIFMSSLLTSIPLMKELHKKDIYCSSSILSCRPVLPRDFWDQPALKNTGDFVQFEHPPVLVTKWKDAKEMVCLSTNAVAGQPDKVWRRSTTKAGELSTISRPLSFKLLQDNMRGVDICSQLLACNQLGGLVLDTNWQCLFWFLVNLSIINSFIVLRETRKSNPPGWLQGGHFSQASYRKRLGFQLAKCAERHALQKQITNDQRKFDGGREASNNPEGIRHRLAKITFRTRRCRCCNLKQQRHESVYGCTACNVNLCKHTHCFWDYHGFSATYKGNPRTGFVEPKRQHDQPAQDLSILQNLNASAMEISTTSLGDSIELDEVFDQEMAPLETSGSEMETDESSQLDPEDWSQSQEHATEHFQKTIKETKNTLPVRQLRILLLALCSGIEKAAKEMDTQPQLIRTWLKDREKRLECDDLGRNGGEAVELLVEWVLVQREQQHPITEKNLFQKASEVHIQTNRNSSFRISYEWAVSFMLQHNLGLHSDVPGVQVPHSMENTCQEFTKLVHRQIEIYSIPLSAVGAMDELSVFMNFHRLVDATDTSKEEAFRLEGIGKPWVNIYLSVLADGTMLPTVLFFKGPLKKNLDRPTNRVILEARDEGFSEKDELEIWTSCVWQHHLISQNGKKTMLVMDGHHGHMSEDCLSIMSTQTLPMIIPSGCNSQLQPLEMCLSPVLKRFLLARWSRFIKQGKAADLKPEDLVWRLVTWLEDAMVCCFSRPQLIQDSFCFSQVITEQQGCKRKASTQAELINSLTEAMIGPEAVDSQLLSKEDLMERCTEGNLINQNSEKCIMEDVEEVEKDAEGECQTESMTTETEHQAQENTNKGLEDYNGTSESSFLLTQSQTLHKILDKKESLEACQNH